MTSNPTAAIAQALAALERAWSGAGGANDVQSAVDSMTDAGLLAVNEALAVMRRQVDALHVRVAAGIAERSRPERGAESLARKTGHRTPERLIAATTGGHAGDAARLIQVGQATAERPVFGVRAAAQHPHVRAALAQGSLSVAAAAAITSMLGKLPPRVDRAAIAETERELCERAGMLTLDELNTLIRRAQANLDPDGLAPMIDDLHARRSLKIRQDGDGMIHVTGAFDPETGAPILAAVDALVTHRLRTSRGHNQPADGAAGADVTRPVAEETRTLAQLRADALATLARHTLGCDRSGSTLANTTVIVRIPLDALTSGTGIAEIDGIAQPVEAGAARRMAADAEIIPVVLGGKGEVLDVGRAQRSFTRAQRLALEERDGGCAFCGLPGSYAEAHHIRWWSRGGPTDLGNGVLLCTACHHRVHNDGWDIRIEPPPGGGHPTAGTVWFVPPSEIDPDRTPRVGGRARFDWTRAA